MGRFPNSVVVTLGCLVFVVQHVSPFIVLPGNQMYDNPIVTGVRFGMAPRFPTSGKTYVSSASSSLRNTGAAIQARSPGFVAVMQNRPQNPRIISLSSLRSSMRPTSTRILGSSFTSIPSLSTISAYRPTTSLGQIRTQNIIQQRPAGQIYTVANPYTIQRQRQRQLITPQMIASRQIAQINRRGPAAATSQILGRKKLIGQTSTGMGLSRGPISRISSGYSRVGTSVRKPTIRPSVSSVKTVKKTFTRTNKPSAKIFTKTSSRKSSRKSSSSRRRKSSKDKAKRKAALRARLRALKTQKMETKDYAV
ncbi:uncharacterized protein LOC117342170 [Pecten maximus]|uniref:uncharacterized protein LOC117342170 n=1 Tax=Pecten maximus TaxID=6579 RepID=UPI0014588C8E|nr:uncharacterized protein LOC117342170 [Pecten maximus]